MPGLVTLMDTLVRMAVVEASSSATAPHKAFRAVLRDHVLPGATRVNVSRYRTTVVLWSACYHSKTRRDVHNCRWRFERWGDAATKAVVRRHFGALCSWTADARTVQSFAGKVQLAFPHVDVIEACRVACGACVHAWLFAEAARCSECQLG
jgi:hypothetical protein